MLSTNRKIQIARLLAAVVRAGRRLGGGSPAEATVRRGGMTWALDLNEGIDFSIYLLGGFQVRTIRAYRRLVRAGDVALDIGANMGAHTLPLAQLVGASGRVIAFEPTAYAFAKLRRNIALNPQLATRVTGEQMMLVAEAASHLPQAVHSSWPLNRSDEFRAYHQGWPMATTGATVATLDGYVQRSELTRVDFIKLDVDGNEYDVLSGGRDVLKEFTPVLVTELAPYHVLDRPAQFDEMLDLLWSLGYELRNLSTGVHLPRDAVQVRRRIPKDSGVNAVATVGPLRR